MEMEAKVREDEDEAAIFTKKRRQPLLCYYDEITGTRLQFSSTNNAVPYMQRKDFV